MGLPARKSLSFFGPINSGAVDLAAPVNLSWWWNFGSLLGLLLFVQILTGLFLSMHYCADADESFSCVVHISRDVGLGWLIRSAHAIGASGFFGCLFMHIARGMYYGSYRLESVWVSGTLLMGLAMAAAFLGYVLVWGQMSFWGATVITNLMTAVPYVGPGLVEWLWGGFSLGSPTLMRFFIFHFLLPFVMAGLAIVHLLYLHQGGSSNPLGVSSQQCKVSFHPYYTYKDLAGGLIFLSIFFGGVLLYPNLLGEPENFVPADPLSTPPHIKPEWYFLWAYAILRAIPSKAGGVIAMGFSIIILMSLPSTMPGKGYGLGHCPPAKVLFWGGVVVVGLLGWVGSRGVEAPFVLLGQGFTLVYFSFFFYLPLAAHSWAQRV